MPDLKMMMAYFLRRKQIHKNYIANHKQPSAQAQNNTESYFKQALFLSQLNILNGGGQLIKKYCENSIYRVSLEC